MEETPLSTSLVRSILRPAKSAPACLDINHLLPETDTAGGCFLAQPETGLRVLQRPKQRDLSAESAVSAAFPRAVV